MERIAGILQPVFAIRTGDDLGIGDTDGAVQLIEWCHRQGARVWQMLPINETGRDHCPYNAISAMAIDPVTLAVSPARIPDLSPEVFHNLAQPAVLSALRQGPVNYPRVKALKRALLEAAYARFAVTQLDQATARAAQFREFVDANAHWIADYALFRALMEENGGLGALGRRPPVARPRAGLARCHPGEAPRRNPAPPIFFQLRAMAGLRPMAGPQGAGRVPQREFDGRHAHRPGPRQRRCLGRPLHF